MEILYISGRERKLLEVLLEKEEEVTIKEIADELEVSSRTVHRDLKNIEPIIIEHSLSLNKKSGIGIQVIGPEEEKEQLKLELFSAAYTDYTPDERISIIIATLLEASEPIKLFSLANELQVTIATVSNDLDRVSDLLEDYQLELVRKRGYGVQIVGKEENKRSALSYLISQHMDEFNFISMIRESIEKKSKQMDTISNRLLGLVDHHQLIVIEKSVENISKKLPYELADSSHVGLVVHLALAIERIKQGENIQFDPVYFEEIKETREFAIAKELIIQLEQMLKIEIPEDEIGYITMHLMGAKLRYDHEYFIEENSMDIVYQAKKLIDLVSKAIGKDLSQNKRLLEDLVTHLKPTVYRLSQGMGIRNPLLKEIKEDYKELFTIINQEVERVFTKLKFPEEEVGFLVLHFASSLIRENEDILLKALVICSSGIGTSKMLSTRLQKEFPEIKEIENRSLFELEQIDLESFHLIVSTVPLKNLVRKYFLISPILTDSEISDIQNYIRHVKTRIDLKINHEKKTNRLTVLGLQKMKVYSTTILDMLDGIQIKVIPGNLPVRNIIQEACITLENDGHIESAEYVNQEILKREKLGGLGVPQTKFALYHTRSEYITKPLFMIYHLEHEVSVRGMDDQDMNVKRLFFMLAPQDVLTAEIEVLSHLSSLMIKDEEAIHTFQSMNEEELKEFLVIHFEDFIKEKISL